jgi:glycosyltransferase involved in cell wall biosynthesis
MNLTANLDQFNALLIQTNVQMVLLAQPAYITVGGPAQSYAQRVFAIDREIMLKGDAVIAVSDFLKNHIMQTYRTIGKKNIFVIKRGVQISNFSREKVTSQRISLMADKIRLPDGKFTICVPARISSGKGHKELIKVLTIMKNVDFVCYFVGDFDKKIKFKKDLDKLILANKMEEKI